MLREQTDIEFLWVADGRAALQAAIDLQATVILQDLVMPLIDGFELVRRYREHPATRDTSIIIFSGIGSVRPSRDTSYIDLVDIADRALYDAKDQGRNRIVGLP